MDIRIYEKTDFDELLRLLDEYFAELEQIEPREIKPSREWLIANCISQKDLGKWLMVDGDKIIGFALVGYPPNCHPFAQRFINNFYIIPSYRRRGLGRQLAEYVLIGLDTVCLYIIHNNTKAKSFWAEVLKDFDILPYPNTVIHPPHMDFYILGKTKGKLKKGKSRVRAK